MTEAMV